MMRAWFSGLVMLACSGCGVLGLGARGSADAGSPTSEPQPGARAAPAKPQKRAARVALAGFPSAPEALERRVGDYSVHRYTGSYRSVPLTVTQEIVARDGEVFTIAYTFEEGAESTELRVRVDRRDDRVLGVSRLEGDVETPLSEQALDALMQKTVFAPDINQELLERRNETCLVGPKELACQLSSYRVLVGERTMTLNVANSDAVPGGDIAGEIVTLEGDVVYRAELVEAGNDAEPSKTLARQ